MSNQGVPERSLYFSVKLLHHHLEVVPFSSRHILIRLPSNQKIFLIINRIFQALEIPVSRALNDQAAPRPDVIEIIDGLHILDQIMNLPSCES